MTVLQRAMLRKNRCTGSRLSEYPLINIGNAKLNQKSWKTFVDVVCNFGDNVREMRIRGGCLVNHAVEAALLIHHDVLRQRARFVRENILNLQGLNGLQRDIRFAKRYTVCKEIKSIMQRFHNHVSAT